MRLGDRATLADFAGLPALELPRDVRDRLAQDRAVVDAAAAGAAPVYGLNTGLGANLGHRIAPEDIPRFQRQLIEGRAVATGPALPPETGRGVLLARLVSIRGSGMSLSMVDHLLAVYAAGLSPRVPRFGSIGASDLTQNAVWALALLGSGTVWRDGAEVEAGRALAEAGITLPALQPKDAMALINHGGLSVALAAQALANRKQGACIEWLTPGKAALRFATAAFRKRDIISPLEARADLKVR